MSFSNGTSGRFWGLYLGRFSGQKNPIELPPRSLKGINSRPEYSTKPMAMSTHSGRELIRHSTVFRARVNSFPTYVIVRLRRIEFHNHKKWEITSYASADDEFPPASLRDTAKQRVGLSLKIDRI